MITEVSQQIALFDQEVESWIKNDKLPKLKTLGLQNAMFTDAIVDKIVSAPILAQPEERNLSMGTMSDAGAQKLIDNASKLGHLKVLNVDDNYISDNMITKLQQAFPNSLVNRDQDKTTWGDDPSDYYPSVTE